MVFNLLSSSFYLGADPEDAYPLGYFYLVSLELAYFLACLFFSFFCSSRAIFSFCLSALATTLALSFSSFYTKISLLD